MRATKDLSSTNWGPRYSQCPLKVYFDCSCRPALLESVLLPSLKIDHRRQWLLAEHRQGQRRHQIGRHRRLEAPHASGVKERQRAPPLWDSVGGKHQTPTSRLRPLLPLSTLTSDVGTETAEELFSSPLWINFDRF